MDLWVKLEDFMDEHGNIQAIRERDRNVVIHLKYRIYSQRGISHEVFMDGSAMQRVFQEMMVGIQQSYEKRIFERLPEITEKTMIAGRKFQIYITSNMPEGPPILLVNPATWAKKWRPFIGSRYWEYLFEHTEEVFGPAEDSQD